MARGKDAHEARQAAVALLGKPLSRRARSCCELCGEGGPLAVLVVDGYPDEDPDEDWAILACERCRSLTSKRKPAPDTLRFLETAMWAEVQPVQVIAVRALRGMAPDVPWAQEALDGLWLSEELEALL